MKILKKILPILLFISSVIISIIIGIELCLWLQDNGAKLIDVRYIIDVAHNTGLFFLLLSALVLGLMRVSK
jgi:hypothetical protein